MVIGRSSCLYKGSKLRVRLSAPVSLVVSIYYHQTKLPYKRLALTKVSNTFFPYFVLSERSIMRSVKTFPILQINIVTFGMFQNSSQLFQSFYILQQIRHSRTERHFNVCAYSIVLRCTYWLVFKMIICIILQNEL